MNIKQEHESYGIIDIHRVQGGARRLFGSDVKHSNAICIQIKKVKLKDI